MLNQTTKHTTIFELPPRQLSATPALNFELPPHLEASAPAEARGLSRDAVRLMVSYQADDRIEHTHFRQIPDYLQAGDLLVINTSATLNAALDARRQDGGQLKLHLSTRLPADMWIVELRQLNGAKTAPFFGGKAGEILSLPGEATVTLHSPHRPEQRAQENGQVRLWIATLNLPLALNAYLTQYGQPIRYNYVNDAWPLRYYQTVYANAPGSAEMPSAGRAFTPELLTTLIAKGIQIAPLILHTGVASLEAHEPPYQEYYHVPGETAQLVNLAQERGRRVVAVGTTVVRALETVTDSRGLTQAGEGWTNLIITPERPLRAVNALLTGLHEPQATHLAMLQALCSLTHLQKTYTAARQEGYLWHEFGDLHLILP